MLSYPRGLGNSSPVFFCDVWFLAFKAFRVTSGGQEAGKEGFKGLFQTWAASM